MCRVDMCTVHIVASDISANVLQEQTLLDYNICSCVTSRSCQIRLNPVSVISTSNMENKNILITCIIVLSVDYICTSSK
jgi:hypothetical protein